MANAVGSSCASVSWLPGMCSYWTRSASLFWRSTAVQLIRVITDLQVTVDLDVLVRSELLEFLKEESETRGATILYATHIFDLGMSEWPTHVVHMREGKQIGQPVAWTPDQPLHGVALQWLKEDRELRRAEEANGVRRKTRGARVETVPSDSETFYRRYDYSH